MEQQESLLPIGSGGNYGTDLKHLEFIYNVIITTNTHSLMTVTCSVDEF